MLALKSATAAALFALALTPAVACDYAMPRRTTAAPAPVAEAPAPAAQPVQAAAPITPAPQTAAEAVAPSPTLTPGAGPLILARPIPAQPTRTN